MNQDIGQEERDLAAALEAAEVQIEQLETALGSRIVIEQAKGVLRERFGWTVEEAFELLRYGARSSRSSIGALAEQVVESSDTPLAITVAREAAACVRRTIARSPKRSGSAPPGSPHESRRSKARTIGRIPVAVDRSGKKERAA